MSYLDTLKMFIRGWQGNNRPLIHSLITPDFQIVQFALVALDVKGFLQINHAFLHAFPDRRITIKEAHTDGDTVHALIDETGTHLRTMASLIPGLAPLHATGKTFHYANVPLDFCFREGKIARIEGNDQTIQILLTLPEQLGIPTD
jgi:hypothetical protein